VEKRRITVAPVGAWEVQEGYPYFVFNVLEELDRPGEWHLDRDSGVLYCWPTADPGQPTLELSMLDTPLVELTDVSHVTFQRLTFELGRADGLVIRGGSDCLVAGCTVRNLGGTAVIVAGGWRHGVFGCDLYQLGRGGTAVRGGDRKTLTPGGHFVENCHVHDFSRVDRTYTPAVLLEGCGNRIAHNSFHHTPGHGMRIEGNDHLVELNEISHVVYESDDQAGLDIYGNPTYRGNVFRWNYWHDIASGRPCGQAGIRLDDAICGVLMYGNVFCRASDSNFGGIQIHGGKENIVDNNVFVDCLHAISFSPWSTDRWKSYLAAPGMTRLTAGEVDIHKPPFSTRYPDLARLEEDPNVNLVWRNVAYRCGDFLCHDRGSQDLRGNTMTDRDPGTTEVHGRGIPWRPEPCELDRLGMRPIPLDEIGPYAHEMRACWPVRQEQQNTNCR
jgi:hypothetical protein